MDDKELIAALALVLEKNPKRLNDWEQDFINSIKQRLALSDAQRLRATSLLAEKSSSRDDKAAAKNDQWDGAEGCERCLDGMVVMHRPLQDVDRSTRFDYTKVPDEMQFREAAFPCTCDRGVLKQQWGKYDSNAYGAWSDGWRTPDRLGDA